MDDKQIIRALTGSARIEIIKLLKKPKTVSEIAEALGYSVSRVSHQLRILRKANAVAFKRNGKTSQYSRQPVSASYGGIRIFLK